MSSHEVPQASALSKLKIDRSVQAPVRKKSGLNTWLVVGAVAVAGGAYLWMPRATEVSTTSVVLSTPSQQYVQLTASGYVVAQRLSLIHI